MAMGSSEDFRGKESSSSAEPVDPEALARLVLRCREFTSHLEQVLPRLPRREETPFLYGQLNDAAGKLQLALRRLGDQDRDQRDERSGILRLLGGKKRRTTGSSEPRIDLQGNAWTIPVTELVNFLSHSGKTGVLWVTTAHETFVLEFSRGNLVHATSNATPKEFRLGEILLRERLLDAGELQVKIELARSADDFLGSYLVKTGRLSPAELRRALSLQVQELFHRLMDAENAIYRFQEGVQMLRAQELEVNITQLLLESARKKDEQRRTPEPPPAVRPPERAPPPEPVQELASPADLSDALAILTETDAELLAEDADAKPSAAAAGPSLGEAAPAPEEAKRSPAAPLPAGEKAAESASAETP